MEGYDTATPPQHSTVLLIVSYFLFRKEKVTKRNNVEIETHGVKPAPPHNLGMA